MRDSDARRLKWRAGCEPANRRSQTVSLIKILDQFEIRSCLETVQASKSTADLDSGDEGRTRDVIEHWVAGLTFDIAGANGLPSVDSVRSVRKNKTNDSAPQHRHVQSLMALHPITDVLQMLSEFFNIV